MNAPTTLRMTVEQFLAWVDARDAALPYDEPKWELFDGVPEMQEHERWAHAHVKLSVMLALRDAIRRAGAPYEIGIDGLGVRTGPKASYQPEAVVFPAGLIGEHDRIAPSPVIVVEVLSPSSMAKDLKTKTAGYAKVATIEHYLVVDPDAEEILHFHRRGKRLVAPDSALADGVLRLDPPGLELAVRDCFKR